MEEQTILHHLGGEKDGATLRIYTRQVSPQRKKIISNVTNKNRMKQGHLYLII